MFLTEFCSSFTEVDAVVDLARKYLMACDCAELRPITFFVLFALRELLNNAVEHGNGLQYQKKVCVAMELSKRGLEIRVCDEGAGLRLNRVIRENAELPSQPPRNQHPAHLPERSRGLSTLLEMGFEIGNRDGAVIARLKPSMMQQLAKR